MYSVHNIYYQYQDDESQSVEEEDAPILNEPEIAEKRTVDLVDEDKINKMYSEESDCCTRKCNKAIPKNVAIEYRYFIC